MSQRLLASPCLTTANCSRSTYTCMLLLGLLLGSSTDASAQTGTSIGPVPNAVALVKGMREGQEVARWAGEIVWVGPTPLQFTANRRRGSWSWHPHTPEELQIQASEAHPRGNSVEMWATAARATSVVVLIAARPGNATHDTATASELPRRPQRARRRQALPDARRAEEFDALPSEQWSQDLPLGDQPSGLGEHKNGPGRGASGDEAHDGLGNGQGRVHGFANGSTRPSRMANKRADLTSGRGGHTPADGGKRHGSAGGAAGATGHIHGSGWLGLIDAPENIAPLVSVGLILIDANILGFGHKMLSRVVRGMGPRALREELVKDAGRLVGHDLARVRDKLARSSRYRSLSTTEQAAIIQRARSAMTRAYYGKARKLFEDRAAEFEQLYARYAARSSRASGHIRTLATENAIAYRKMSQAAEAEYAAIAATRTTATRPKLIGPRKSTKIARNTPGTATGGRSLTPASGNWLRGTHRNAAPLPKQVADALRGRTFKSWDSMRRTIWKTVAADKTLHGPFVRRDLKAMRKGKAPKVDDSQSLGRLQSYVLHHRTPIQHGGGVYDLDNLAIVTPRLHKDVLDRSHHQGVRR